MTDTAIMTDRNSNTPLCRHIKTNGRRCGSPALRGECFCFYHHPTRRPPVRTRPSHPSFYIPPITDPETLQIALSELGRRIADNTLSTQRARLLRETLQMAQANLPMYLDEQGPPPDRTDVPDLSTLLSAPGLRSTPTVPKH